MADAESTKACARCKQEKPLSAFLRRKYKTGLGWHPYCKECKNGLQRDRYFRDVETSRAKERERSRRERPKRRKYFAEYYQANKTRLDTINRHWACINRKRAVAYTRKWQKANRETVNRNLRVQAARRRSAEGRFTASDVKALFSAQRRRCAYCRQPLKSNYHVDHIKPVSKGGSNHRRNIQLACPHCNMSKSDKDPVEFARTLGLLI